MGVRQTRREMRREISRSAGGSGGDRESGRRVKGSR